MIETYCGQTTLQILRGQLAERDVDAVVRETDAELQRELSPGGLAEAGGTALQDAIDAAGDELGDGGLADAEVVTTDAGDLRAKAVIHTALPAWKDRFHGEKIDLEHAYENALVTAIENEWTTIAFPPLGIGERGFPGYEATVIALNTIDRVVTLKDRRTDYRGAIDRVELVVASEQDFELYQSVYDAYAHRWGDQKVGT